MAYQFVQDRIALPINQGMKQLASLTPFPIVDEVAKAEVKAGLTGDALIEYGKARDKDAYLEQLARSQRLDRWWNDNALPLNVIGLVVAIILIYMVGAVLGSFIGRRIYARGEELFSKVPLIKQVYPSVKQVTDFLVSPAGEADKMRFSRVVAVEYPRKGLWSVGLVTGSTMRMIQDRTGKSSLTVFVPSSPTPFTGYVITVPKEDTIDLPVTVEEAIRFAVSAGVIVPPSQLIENAEDAALEAPPTFGGTQG